MRRAFNPTWPQRCTCGCPLPELTCASICRSHSCPRTIAEPVCVLFGTTWIATGAKCGGPYGFMWLHTFLLQVRFSDEKRFCIRNDGPVRCWRRSDQRFKQGFTRGTRKHCLSIMVWLAIGSSMLLLCDQRQDSASYQNKILTPALGFIRPGRSTLSHGRVFMHDGASCHTSASTRAWLAANRVTVLEPWPACSPDLNPVEHCWSQIAKALIDQSFPDRATLWAAVQKAWSEVPASYVRSLYGSMVRRMTAVKLAKGGNTKY